MVSDVPAVLPRGLNPDELARRLAALSGEELREFLILLDNQRRAIGQLSGQGTLTAGAPELPDVLTRVTATFTASWRVEAPIPQGSGSGTTHGTGTGTGDPPAIKSPAAAALWDYLKKVSPQDNTQFLATLEAIIKAVIIVWLMAGSSNVAGEIASAIQRAGDAVTTVLEAVEKDDTEDPES